MRQEAGKAIQGKVQEVRGYVGRLHKAEAAAKDTLKMYAEIGCSVPFVHPLAENLWFAGSTLVVVDR